MTDDSNAAPQPDHLQRIIEARRRGDLAAARRHLQTARAEFPGPLGPAFLLQEAALLLDAGDADRAASKFEDILKVHSDNLAALANLARLARNRGDAGAARRYIQTALPLDPDRRNAGLQLLHADLLLDDGEPDQAAAVLDALDAACPGDARVLLRLSNLARGRGDFDAALRYSGRLVERAAADGPPDVHLHHARLLLEMRKPQEAIAHLETLRARRGPEIMVMFTLIKAHDSLGRHERSRDLMAELVAAHPTDARVLGRLFTTYAKQIDTDRLTAIAERLRGRIPDGLANELGIEVLMQTGRFDAAYRQLRRFRRASRTEAEARKLAAALFGARRHRLGLRYLRFCLRRWPSSQVLLGHYVANALRAGDYAGIARRLDAQAAAVPGHVILSHRFLLHAYQDDLKGALACYEALRKDGHANAAHRRRLATLIFAMLDPAEAGPVFDRIGGVSIEEAGPHARAGLYAQQLMEFDLERRRHADGGRFDGLDDWVRSRPGSTVAAVRLINDWRASAPAAGGAAAEDPEPAEIPRRIIQYWHGAEVPRDVSAMIESWRAAPGFSHQLFDRSRGLKFLRENMGPRWVGAFRMAHDPAQEADFLRLCLLAHSGGVYADADDDLTGDLAGLLTRAGDRGLILCREPLGGLLANNFIASPARHPVVVSAARMARAALLQRSNETVWSSTGPGLLTRAVAQFLARTDPARARRQITLLDWPEVTGDILMHNPVGYKTTAAYWNRPHRPDATRIWERLDRALADAPAA